MTEEEKMAFIERLVQSGANVSQINLGDGTQNFYVGKDSPKPERKPKPQPKAEEADAEELRPCTRETFALNPKRCTPQHMQYVGSMLMQAGVISVGRRQRFEDLMAGTPNDCQIVWTGKIGVGTLRDLFNSLLDNQYILPAPTAGKYDVLESHFVKPTGEYLSNVRSGSTNRKGTQLIEACLRVLSIPVADIVTAAQQIIGETIQDYFQDIRVDPHESY